MSSESWVEVDRQLLIARPRPQAIPKTQPHTSHIHTYLLVVDRVADVDVGPEGHRFDGRVQVHVVRFYALPSYVRGSGCLVNWWIGERGFVRTFEGVVEPPTYLHTHKHRAPSRSGTGSGAAPASSCPSRPCP